VDWNAPVDPELYLDIDIEEARRIMEEKAEEPVILGSSLLLNQSFSGPGWPEPTGWGDEEENEVTKPSEPTKTEEPVILTRSFLLNWSFTG
ncbi:DNA repair protein recA-like protein, partial [Trifolium medium]|nr:DNA repair protein recA-like protein [Trifolium medium]